jgi:signal transduction histidine kinase
MPLDARQRTRPLADGTLTAKTTATDPSGQEAATGFWARWSRALRPPAEPLAGAARIAKARELLRCLPWIVGFNFLLAALTAIVLADYHEPWKVGTWLALVAATAIPGTRYWLRFRAAPPPRSVSQRFIRNSAIYSFVVASPWLVILTALFPFHSEGHEMAVIFVIAGVTAGATAMVAALPEVAIGYVMPLLVGLIQALLREGEILDLVMAAMLVAYGVFLVGVVALKHEAFVADVAVRENSNVLMQALAKAQRRLSRVFAKSDETIVLFDADDRLLLTNYGKQSPLAAFAGAPAAGTLFADWWRSLVRAGAFAAAEDREEEFIATTLAIWRDPPPEALLRLAGGKYLRAVLRQLDDGEKVLIFSDATQSHANAKAAAEHERRLSDFAEVTGEWWWEQDADLRFTKLSDRVADWASKVPGNAIGKRRDDLVDPTYEPDAWRDHVADLAARRPFREFRYRVRADFGKDRYTSINGKPVFGAKGEFLGYRGVARDITAEVEAAATLRAAKEKAVYASQVKSQFLAHMSHELRTPLNAVIGYSEMMTQRTFGPLGDPKYEEYAGHIHDSGKYLLGLIEDILEMSTVEAGGRKLAEEEVDLPELVNSSLKMVEVRANDGGLTLTTDMRMAPPAVRGDARALKQIVLNLLVNAVKFTPRGGRVTLAVMADGAGAEFRVIDSGIGMDAAAIAAAWTPFARGDSEHARDYPGTGLGLPLVKALTELHGGTVEIQSAVGKGTTVIVRLPASRVIARSPSHALA